MPCSVCEKVREKLNKELSERYTSAFCALMRLNVPAATQSTTNVDREIIRFHDYRLGNNKRLHVVSASDYSGFHRRAIMIGLYDRSTALLLIPLITARATRSRQSWRGRVGANVTVSAENISPLTNTTGTRN